MSQRSDTNSSTQSSRRSFLKTSAAGLALAASASDLSRRVYAAGSDEIKIGLIGCGGRGTGAALDAMRADEGVRLVAMYEIFEDKLQASKKQIQEAMPDQFAVKDDHCFTDFQG